MNEGLAYVAGCLLGTLFGVLVASLVLNGNHNDEILEIKVQAIELGYAEWDVSADGDIKFQWKEINE